VPEVRIRIFFEPVFMIDLLYWKRRLERKKGLEI
jgi:hypothetical protein